MKIGNILKAFQYSLLQEAGVAVTPEQVGLKIDPATLSRLSGVGGSFSRFLTPGSVPGLSGLALPTPPTPPTLTDLSSAKAAELQAKYNQELLTYNQNIQLYHTKILQLLMQRIGQLQQSQGAEESSQAVGGGGASALPGGSSFAFGDIVSDL